MRLMRSSCCGNDSRPRTDSHRRAQACTAFLIDDAPRNRLHGDMVMSNWARRSDQPRAFLFLRSISQLLYVCRAMTCICNRLWALHIGLDQIAALGSVAEETN